MGREVLMEIKEQEREFISGDILGYLKQHEEKTLLRFLTCGSVDDGKSTLIGRLLYDSKMIYEDQLAAVEKKSTHKGAVAGQVDLSLLMDGLKAEQEQGITIDVAYRFFSTSRRKFIIADTPGHEQYTRNMATGASSADLAILLIDARHGVLPQTKRHSFIASLLGIRHLVVAVNKMDLVDWSKTRFMKIRSDYIDFAARLGIADTHFLPMSALDGDNVVNRSANMPWYKGPSLLDHLESVHIASDRNLIDLRSPVQMVSRPDLTFRGYSGTIASGVVRVGDELMALPSGKRSRVSRLVTFDGDLEKAFPPQAVTITLEDEIDISRGDMLVHPNNVPRLERILEAQVVWMHDKALRVGKTYLLKCGTQLVPAETVDVRYRFDINTLHKESPTEIDGRAGLELNEIGRVVLETTRPMLFDAFKSNKATGSFILIDRLTNVTVGAGMILERKPNELIRTGREIRQARLNLLEEERSQVSTEARAERFGQQAVTLWLTGLPRAGKSTIALELEKRLWDSGNAVNVLDGVNMRLGISKDLGFTADERSEASRRAAETARIFNRAGLITIAAFVSPYSADRERASDIVGADRFLGVYVKASEALCEERDALLHPDGDGLYAKARRGEIKHFTGVSAPYQAPRSADLTLDTEQLNVSQCVDQIVALLVDRGVISS